MTSQIADVDKLLLLTIVEFDESNSSGTPLSMLSPGCENIVITVPLESPVAATACPGKATTNPAVKITPPKTDKGRGMRAGIPAAERTSFNRWRQRAFVNAKSLSSLTARR